MKKRSLLLASSLLLALGGAIGTGLTVERDILRTDATGTSTYGVLGVIEGVGTSWTLGSPLDIDLSSDGDNLIVKTGWSLTAGDKFKFVLDSATGNDWSSAKGIEDLKYGTACRYFAEDKDKNINVLSSGVYDVYMNKSYEITINFAATSPEATYSYVVSYDSSYTGLNGYTTGTIWSGTKPTLAEVGSNKADNLKIQRDFSELEKDYDFWAIYKIDDRYLGNFQKFSLFVDSSYSNEITISGTQKVYFENKETSADADVYAAVKWVYDLCCNRNDYSYTDEHGETDTYAHSICNLLTTGVASTFIANYEGIEATVNGAGVLDRASFYSNLDSKHVSASSVVDILSAHVAKNGGQSNARDVLPDASQSNFPFVVTGAAAAIAIAFGSFFFIRRKREN